MNNSISTGPHTRRARDNLWIYFISVLPAVAVALLAPDDVLTRYPSLRAYTSVCQAIIPAIDKLARVSSFPEVTQLVLSIVWSLVPLQTVLFLAKGTYAPKFKLWREKRVYFGFLIVVVAIFVGSMAFFFDVTPRDLEGNLLNEWVLRSASTSRLWLGVIAGFFMSAIALMIGLSVIFLRYVPMIYFEKNGENKL